MLKIFSKSVNPNTANTPHDIVVYAHALSAYIIIHLLEFSHVSAVLETISQGTSPSIAKAVIAKSIDRKQLARYSVLS